MAIASSYALGETHRSDEEKTGVTLDRLAGNGCKLSSSACIIVVTYQDLTRNTCWRFHAP